MAEISVLLPVSLVADGQGLLDKTIKVGVVARALAIFRVREVVVYDDRDPHLTDPREEARLITTILRYIETPQYLRKYLFPKRKELRYAGMLPPLRTPHHPLRGEKESPGDFREAVVVRTEARRSILEMGLGERGVLGERVRVGERLTVKLGRKIGGKRILVERVSKEESGEYWGYEVTSEGSLADTLKRFKAYFKIGTSRYGKKLEELIRELTERKPERVVAVFGGPRQGLYRICEREGRKADELFDIVANTIPNQGTATVRTEEAVFVTLALINAVM